MNKLAAIIAITVLGVVLLYLTAPRCTDASQSIQLSSVLLAGCAKVVQ